MDEWEEVGKGFQNLVQMEMYLYLSSQHFVEPPNAARKATSLLEYIYCLYTSREKVLPSLCSDWIGNQSFNVCVKGIRDNIIEKLLFELYFVLYFYCLIRNIPAELP